MNCVWGDNGQWQISDEEIKKSQLLNLDRSIKDFNAMPLPNFTPGSVSDNTPPSFQNVYTS